MFVKEKKGEGKEFHEKEVSEKKERKRKNYKSCRNRLKQQTGISKSELKIIVNKRSL
jgi:hypothetical protein